MNRKIFLLFLITLLLTDIGYSFLQHYSTPFDGDMPGGIVPAEYVKPVLENPLGIKIFKEHTTYANPNRFFCHWSFYTYFNSVPFLLQKTTNPLNSAYLSCAIAKTIIQVLMIYLLALAVSGNLKFKLEFLISAVLITPLFQTNGYNNYMGIIDPSTTYTFFYALPAAVLLIYFIPFFLKYFYNKELKGFKYLKICWIPLALVCSLSGPLNPGISLVVSLLLFIQVIYKNFSDSKKNKLLSRFIFALKEIPKDYYFFLLPISIFSIYSLFLGSYNALAWEKIPLSTLYFRLPQGLYYSLTRKLGFPIIIGILLINTIIINKKFPNEEGKKILKAFKWIGFFSLVYILLLPLGGYRIYRPNVLRYDTILPITLLLIFIFGKTTLFIFKNISKRQKMWYIPLIILVLTIFTNSDEAIFNKNKCERNGIMQIAQSSDSIVKIDGNCTVLSWTIIEKPSDSELKTKLLRKWNIISEDKLFYQNPTH